MSSNPDPIKQAQVITFSRMSSKTVHYKIFFNNVVVSRTDSEKHLGLHLDSKLSFEAHIKMNLKKVNKAKVCHKNLKKCYLDLITICKTFIRLHLDHGGVVFVLVFNTYFLQRLESI